MQDLIQFTVTGKVGVVDYKIGNNPQARVVVYAEDDYKDTDGNWHERDYVYAVTFWGARATYIGNYINKGDRVIVQSKVVSVKDSEGKIGYFFNGDNIIKLNSAPVNMNDGGNQTSNKNSGGNKSKKQSSDDDLDDILEDIPF